MARALVACLEVILEGADENETQSIIEIHGSEQFYLGRNAHLCRHSWSDPVISNRHLRIHCIIYEQDPQSDIPPFVYATDLSTNGTYLKKANTECASSQGRGICMGRNNGAFLLDDGDKLRLSASVTLVFRSEPIRKAHLTAAQELEKQLFSSRYLLTGRVLGIGAYGKVMIAVQQRTQHQVACKVIDTSHLSLNHSASILRRAAYGGQGQEHGSTGMGRNLSARLLKYFQEFEILKNLSHPNIVAIEKVFLSPKTIYLFQGLVTGGDLFSYIEYKGGRLVDVEAAVIIRQVLKGIEYLHGQDIVHRDLKPDNILMTSLDDGARIVITDFGNARFLPNELGTGGLKTSRPQRMFSLVGTLEYAAPEVHRRNRAIPAEEGYSKSIDMWSTGSITGTLLSGGPVFNNPYQPQPEHDSYERVLKLASTCDLSMLDDDGNATWSVIGSRPKDFIKKLLVLEEEYRMTVTEALAHPWFSNKCHAAEFDALYQRATRDWKPRHKAAGLVESIPEVTTESTASQLFLTKERISRYFAPPPDSSNDNDRGILAMPSRRRANTPLPTIAENYEDYDDSSSQLSEQFHNPEDYEQDSNEQRRQGSKQVHNADENDLNLRTRTSSDNIHGTSSTPHNAVYPVDENMYDQDDNEIGNQVFNGGFSDYTDVMRRLHGMTSQYDFSIPAPPPYTPGTEADSLLVPETPPKRRKLHYGGQ